MMYRRVYLLILLIAGAGSLYLEAQENESFKITHQPYLQALTDSSVSIVWTTNRPAIAWVELAPDDSSHFYQKERPKYFAAACGIKKTGTVHQVDLKDLEPDTKYRYRVYSTEVIRHQWVEVDYGRTVATRVYQAQPLEFTTPGPATRTRFAMINDIHGRNEVMNNLLDQADLPDLDFVVFNGDMANSLLSEDQVFEDYMETAIERFASEKPMYYARGNHETRGPFAIEFPKYFPTPTGELYYMLYHGESAIIVLDCGEDKPDSDIEYGGITDMDFYRSQQAEWLKKAVQEEKFVNARYKIAICHMPPYGGWHGEQEVMDKFVPLLNEAGIQIYLAAHFHRHTTRTADREIHFPVIVNSNNHVLKADLNEEEGKFWILDQEGKEVYRTQIQPLR